MPREDVLMPPSVSSHEADVARLAQALLDYLAVEDRWADASTRLAEPVESIDFLVTLPGRSLDSLIAAQQIVRLSVDAALVAVCALNENAEEPSRGFIRRILDDQAVALGVVDEGVGSLWVKIRASVAGHPFAATAAFLGLVGIALCIASAIVAFVAGATVAGAAIGFGLEMAGLVAGMAGGVLQIADVMRGQSPTGPFEAIDCGKVSDDTVVHLAGVTGQQSVRADAHGRLEDIMRFADSIRGLWVHLVTLEMLATGEEDATLMMDVTEDFDWAPAHALAEEFYIQVDEISPASRQPE